MRDQTKAFLGRSLHNILLALILLIPAVARAQFTVITNNNAITIKGYTGTGGDVSVPAIISGMPVTQIGDFAFWKATNVTKVTLPDSIGRIGHQAFIYCSSLVEVTMGNNITNIGQMAFAACTSLPTITIPASVTGIGDYPFTSCSSLTQIVVDPLNPGYSSTDGVLFSKSGTTLIQYPNGKLGSYGVPLGVTDILDLAFNGCTNLTGLTLPDTVTNIGYFSFGGCTSIRTLTLPDSPLNIGWNTFTGCAGITNLNLGNGIVSIGPYAFQDCSNIASVTFPNSLEYLAERAFLTCTKLGSVAIPGKLQTLAPYTFFDCISLTNASIGEGIVTIGEAAFGFCTGLSSITIPRSVTNVAKSAFTFCSSLQGAYFRGNAPSIDPDAFYGVYLTLYYMPGTSGWASSINGVPAFLWNPTVQVNNADFGVKTNRFGFKITGTADIPIVIEATTQPGAGSWNPLQICTLTNGAIYFSDSNWTNNRARFYRIRSP